MAKMGKGWLKHGSKKDRFDWEDYTYLVDKGKTNIQIMDRLWDNQKKLRSKDRQGREDDQGKKGIFDKIQRWAQKDWQASTDWDSASGVDDWNFDLWGNQKFGEEDIKAARKAGASKYQIRQLYARAKEEGLHSRGAREWIKERNVAESDWDYGAHGGWGFDMEDIRAMKGDDYGLDQIIEARDWADKHGLTIGEKVVGHIQKLEDKAAARSLKADVRWGEKRDKIFQDKIEKTQAATMQKTAAAAEAGRIASMRGMGSQRLGASGAAIFKNKGLTSLGKGTGGGTSQFTRPSNHWPVHKLY